MYDIYTNLVKVVEDYNPSPALPLQERGLVTQYFYNARNQLIKLVDAENNERNMSYDLVGRQMSIEDLHAKNDTQYTKRTYEYDNNGNLVAMTNQK